jgi:hypothetical protein
VSGGAVDAFLSAAPFPVPGPPVVAGRLSAGVDLAKGERDDDGLGRIKYARQPSSRHTSARLAPSLLECLQTPGAGGALATNFREQNCDER